jgi:GDP-4-dehydro-6-deoxy-D-mannose reductase
VEPGTRNVEPGTVLVTGATGFAGSHLAARLRQTSDRIVGWSRADVDLLDRDKVRAKIRELAPSFIYHCAGAPHVAQSWSNTAHPLRNNVVATHYLVDAVRRAGLRCRVLITGSAAIYHSSQHPITEDGVVAPASPYALSKLAQEQLGTRATVEDGIDVVITRSFNHTGPGQSPSFAAPALARQFALIEAGRLEPVIRVGNLDARREFTDVRDTVRAYELLMKHARSATPYNVCSGSAFAIREVFDGLQARVKKPVRVEIDPSRLRPNDTPILMGNGERLRAETGWRPEISFDRMLDDLLNHWRDRVSRE